MLASSYVTLTFSSVFLTVSSTVVALAGVLIKPAVNVEIKGGLHTSETLPLLLCSD